MSRCFVHVCLWRHVAPVVYVFGWCMFCVEFAAFCGIFVTDVMQLTAHLRILTLASM